MPLIFFERIFMDIKDIENKIIHADCMDILKELPDKCIDLVVCDLPYGTTASSWDKIIDVQELWAKYNRIVKDNGTVILFANGLFTPRVMLSNLKDYKYRLVWVKRNSTNFVHAKNRPMVKSEDILIFSKGAMGHKSQLGNKRMTYNPQGIIPVNKIRKDGKTNFTNTLAGKRPSHKEEFIVEYTNYPTDILTDFPELPPNQKIHTNEKPIELLEYLIKTYSNENELILDNCSGSGNLAIACMNTKRRFICIEKDYDYWKASVERLKNAQAQLKLF